MKHDICGLFVTTEGECVLWKESSTFYSNGARTIQSIVCGAQYVTQVSLNYMLVYILKLVYIYIYIYIYIYSPNRRLVFIYQPTFLGVYA